KGIDVLGLDAAAVEDPDRLGGLFRGELREQAAEVAVDLAGLGVRRVDARPDGPDRLVGEDDLLHLRRRHAGEPGAQLTLDRREGESLAPLLRRLADAEDRREPVGHGGAELEIDDLVGLADLLAPFGVADEHPTAAEVGEHRRRDLAGVGARGLVVTRLRPELDRAAGEHLGDGGEGGEGRADDDLHPARAPDRVADRAGEDARLRDRPVHLPVADDDGWPHAGASVSASTPGRGPMSSPISASGISRIPTARPAALSGRSATTVSRGSTRRTPRRRAASSAARAVSTRSGSTSDRPIAWPSARRNVNAMPPPT